MLKRIAAFLLACALPALAAAQSGALSMAKQQYDGYENTWFDIEDAVRAKWRHA